DARDASQFEQQEWTCTSGSRAHVRAGGLDHFASRGADEAQQIANVRIVGLVQSYLEGIAAERAQPFDGSIEVELARGARRVDDGSRADDEVGKNRRSATAAVRVQPPLVRVDGIVGG